MRRDKPVRYIKAWTSAVHDPKIYRLTFAERGIWWSALLLSGFASDVPGMFVVNDEPMSMREICNDLHCKTPADERAVADAFRKFTTSELMTIDDWGYTILNWSKWQAEYNRETADESAARVRRWRAKRKAERAADGAPPPNVHAIRGHKGGAP